MFAFKSTWKEQPTFKLMSHDKDCFFLEAIYDPENRVLAIITKEKLEKPQILNKVDQSGRNVYKGGTPVFERRFMTVPYEFYITDQSDISEFINRYCTVNKSIISDFFDKQEEEDIKKLEAKAASEKAYSEIYKKVVSEATKTSFGSKIMSFMPEKTVAEPTESVTWDSEPEDTV